jgi:hypothetical protein
MKLIEPRYLGDGVYAQFDGYRVILTTGHHNAGLADNIIFLEPEQASEVVKFCREARHVRNIVLHLNDGYDVVSIANKLDVDVELVREVKDALE